MFCKNCGAEMNPNQAICIRCGVKVGVGNRFCQNCGRPVAEGATFCNGCGFALQKPAFLGLDGEIGGQSRLMVALLCFFLGAFGVHNFILGENKKGIFKIVATLWLGTGLVLGVLDLVKIFNNTYEVSAEKFI